MSLKMNAHSLLAVLVTADAVAHATPQAPCLSSATDVASPVPPLSRMYGHFGHSCLIASVCCVVSWPQRQLAAVLTDERLVGMSPFLFSAVR